jgi:signal transduction histidine kinase
VIKDGEPQRCETVVEHVMLPNGLRWRDGALYFSESFAHHGGKFGGALYRIPAADLRADKPARLLDKDHMDQENYDDTMDVLEMLRGNLQKVSEHGQNTTRTLKAMEEMLKDRSGGIVPMNLLSVLRQNEEMLDTYYANDISQYGIKTEFALPQGEVMINGNADQLSKVIMSLLGNAVYAVVKKAQRLKGFTPTVSLSVKPAADRVQVTIRDNGIGIEDTIINKVFDPFFTTKTTGEASGVGLYLSREIIQNHGGDIQAKSVKDEYSEFTFTLPINKA